MRRFTPILAVLIAVVLALCSLPAQPLEASATALALGLQAEGTTIGSGLLTGLAPIATVLLTSAVTWVANSATEIMADWDNLAKYAAMSFIGVVVSVVIGALGGTVDPNPLTWGAEAAQGIAGAVVAALVYKLGQKN